MSDQIPGTICPLGYILLARCGIAARAGRYRLEGTRCTACGEKFFPPRTGLICPACHDRAMEPYQCAQTGEIVAVALDDVGFPALGYGDDMPRVQAIVRLDDGIHLMVDIMQVADPG